MVSCSRGHGYRHLSSHTPYTRLAHPPSTRSCGEPEWVWLMVGAADKRADGCRTRMLQPHTTRLAVRGAAGARAGVV
jgi:hypothetical protein